MNRRRKVGHFRSESGKSRHPLRRRRFASNLFFLQRREPLDVGLEDDHVGSHSRKGLPPDDHLGFRLFSRAEHCCTFLGSFPLQLDFNCRCSAVTDGIALQAFLHEQELEIWVVAVRIEGRNGNFESTNLGTRPGLVSFFRGRATSERRCKVRRRNRLSMRTSATEILAGSSGRDQREALVISNLSIGLHSSSATRKAATRKTRTSNTDYARVEASQIVA